MEAAILFVLVLVLLFAGVPVAISLGLSSLILIAVFSQDSMSSVALQLFTASQNYTLLAIPFFVLASAFMSTGGVAARIIRFAIASVGHIRGGLAIASVLACMLFAALSGSSPATVVAIGTIAIAGMRKVGYTRDFAAGIIANAGTLGILIPPSIVMVVYSAATDVSVGRMFLAGVVPGIVAGLMLMGTIYVMARVKNLPAEPWHGFGEIIAGGKEAGWGLFLIIIILGGIYGGVFTPTEAAAVAAVYAWFVALFIYRDMGPLAGIRWIQETDPKRARIGFSSLVYAVAFFFVWMILSFFVPDAITDMMLGYGFNWFTFLIAVNVLLLLGGQFMEPSGLLLIVAPVVFPIAMELGIDPVHLGIIMVVNMEIGMITPPIGLNLFVTSGITGMSLIQVVRAALPFVAVLFAFLIIVTYVPVLSTWLPYSLMGPEIVTR